MSRSDHRHSERAFSLLELLVVVAIIATLVSILLPSLGTAREVARAAACSSNLHALGVAGAMYQQDNDGLYWQYSRSTTPMTYFWGSDSAPVDFHASWFMGYLDDIDGHLQCPSLPWGSYVPQGQHVIEPTTAYGYNAYCLDPATWGRVDSANHPLTTKRLSQITAPASLFVFADAAMYWSPGGVPILQNSTSLDPVATRWGPNTTPTTHFRHLGRANALCADGHADGFGLEGGSMIQPSENLAFVGTANDPHYDQD